MAMSEEAMLRVAKCKAEGLCYSCLQKLPTESERRELMAQGKLYEARVIRQCHEPCYKSQMRAIQLGLDTLEDAIARGEIANDKTVGRPPIHPASIRAAKMRQQQAEAVGAKSKRRAKPTPKAG